jgi:hypothetical protein
MRSSSVRPASHAGRRFASAPEDDYSTTRTDARIGRSGRVSQLLAAIRICPLAAAKKTYGRHRA